MRLDLADPPSLSVYPKIGTTLDSVPLRQRSHKNMALGLMALLTLYVYFAGRVDKAVDVPTAALIQSLNLDVICGSAKSTTEIVRCARAAQDVIAERIPGKACTTKGQSIEPLAVFKRGYACCYGRARLMELILTYYQIPSRRVSIYHTDVWGVFSLLIPGIPSHAAVEVKTPKGWMGMDSNEPFVLMDRAGSPLTYSAITDPKVFASLATEPKPKAFFQSSYIVVYGLYSRHGFFLGPNLPGPEINFLDFYNYNFLGGNG